MTAQCVVGRLDPYISGDDFDDYLEQADNYFELNAQMEETWKVRLFLNLVGPAINASIFRSFDPERCLTKKFDEVFARCKKLFVGERNSVVECVERDGTQQKEGEPFEDSATSWQALANECEFGAIACKTLFDRFVAELFSNEYSDDDERNFNASNSIVLGDAVDTEKLAAFELEMKSARSFKDVAKPSGVREQQKGEDETENGNSWLCADHWESTAALRSVNSSRQALKKASSSSKKAVVFSPSKKAGLPKKVPAAKKPAVTQEFHNQRQKREALPLCGHIVRRHSTWLHKVASLGSLNELLQLLRMDASTVVTASNKRLESYERILYTFLAPWEESLHDSIDCVDDWELESEEDGRPP